MEKQITEMTRAGRECFFQWVWFSSFILFFIFLLLEWWKGKLWHHNFRKFWPPRVHEASYSRLPSLELLQKVSPLDT